MQLPVVSAMLQLPLLPPPLLLLLLTLLGSGALASVSTRQRDIIDIKVKIIELQCLARCENSSEHRHLCIEQCKKELLRAPRRGKCPSMQQQLSLPHYSLVQTRLPCLDNCNYDHDCAEVQKCCASACGPVCMEALAVRNDTQLPPIPKIRRHKLTGSHKVELTIESSLLPYYFHVEVRTHIGRTFAPRKLGMWQWQPVDKSLEAAERSSKLTEIFFNIRPGRWYQVRVAAVNAFGFRGYSQPSHVFALASKPKPPKAPNDLKIISRQTDGRYVSVKLVWCPSKSNLPVEKYKIIWSLYVSSNEDSLISQDAYVKDTHQYEIKKLQPDSSYYIQVQAMSISGSRRLKSDKKDLLYNTTQQQSLQPYAPLQCATQNYKRKYQLTHSLNQLSNSFSSTTITSTRTENSLAESVNTNEISITPASNLTATSYEVRFRFNRKFGMIVQILGFQPHKEKVYELCPQATNCEHREFNAIRVKKDSLEFSKLKYNTTYVLKALRPNSINDDLKNAFVFTTPKCENFRKRFSKMQIKCNE